MSFTNPQEVGRPVTILDEGVTLVSGVTSLDFQGAGVTGTAFGTAVTETITGGAAGLQVIGEIPTGTLDGTNATFTLAHTPTGNSLKLYNGVRLTNTSDFTLSGNTITFINIPSVGDSLQADYEY
jgi:hypothetical protein